MGYECCSRLGFLNALAVTTYGAATVAAASAAPLPAAGVKRLALTHFVPSYDPTLSDDDWSAPVRRHYRGEIIVGHDVLDV